MGSARVSSAQVSCAGFTDEVPCAPLYTTSRPVV